MKKNEVQIGGTYRAKVTDKVVSVRIDAENPHGGWDATNLETNRKVRIKSAQRLRAPDSDQPSPTATTRGRSAKAADQATTEAKPKKAATRAKQGDDGGKKIGCLEAAVKVLGESSDPMNCKDMVEAMTAKGYWASPGGKTPHATLYSAILREITVKGDDSRFRKVERGKFTLA
jgi:hypothetical protein